jgi:hypothetical protein
MLRTVSDNQIEQPDNGPIRRTDGIYGVRVMGKPLSEVRYAADSLKPSEDDSWGVAAGKNVVRGSLVVGAAGMAMIAVL